MSAKQIKAEFDCNNSNELTDMLFGINVEHVGRLVYGGLYDRACPVSDEKGFRKDVAKALKDMQLSSVRYPGGNFVSGYNWRDGIGKKRPRRLNLAWNQVETNEVGLHEMFDYAEDIGSKLMMNLNLGNGTVREALELFEYCNFDGDTELTTERKKNGREKPFAIKYWGLGNEMDGEWQIGHLSAKEYAQKAKEVAKYVRTIDPNVKLTLVGSSQPVLKTFLQWDKEVLDIAYDDVDAISLHLYLDHKHYYRTKSVELKDYVSLYKGVEYSINALKAVIEETKLRKKSKKDVYIAMDEWNIWHTDSQYTDETKWAISNKRYECIYSFKDCMLMANIINLIIRYSSVVKVASLFGAVNSLAPIMARKDGAMFKQTTYHPYAFASKYMRGKYIPLKYEHDKIQSENGEFDALNMVSTQDGIYHSIFAVNNSVDDYYTVSFELPFEMESISSEIIKNEPDEVNSFDNPDRVAPKGHTITIDGKKAYVNIPAFSMVMIRLKKI